MRPSLFSRPSMYFALRSIIISIFKAQAQIAHRWQAVIEGKGCLPLGRSALLLNLSEDAVRFISGAMCTCRHLSIALDLLLPTHIASLFKQVRMLAIKFSQSHETTHGCGLLVHPVRDGIARSKGYIPNRASEPCKHWGRRSYPCYPPLLRFVEIIGVEVGVGEHLRGEVGREVLHLRHAVGPVHAEDLWWLMKLGRRHARHLEAHVRHGGR